MQLKHTLLALAIGVTSLSAHAANLNTGDLLTITPGTGTYGVNSYGISYLTSS